MTGGDACELVVTAPVARVISEQLPGGVAAAVIELVTTALIAEPRRVGKPLRGRLQGVFAARRGTYRVLYRIDDERREVIVLRVDHRRAAYRPVG